MPTTCSPRSSSAIATDDPIKPATPVTSKVMARLLADPIAAARGALHGRYVGLAFEAVRGELAMTDEVYPVPKEWAEKALINADRYAGNVPRVGRGSRRLLAARGAADRLDQAVHHGQGNQLPRGRFRHQMVRRRHAQPLRQLPRPPPRRARRRHRDHLGTGRSGRGWDGRSPTASCTPWSAASPTR